MSELLYHYTTASGFLGIIQSGELHATDTRFMNDESETTYAQELLAELESGLNKADYADWESITRWPWPLFAVCFCATGDLLSQWRGYGTGNGLSIGFEPASLLADYPPPPVPWQGPAEWFRVDVTYDRQTQMDNLKKAIDLFRKDVLGLDEADHNWGTALDALITARLACKDQSFEEEQESRLVHLDPGWPASVRHRVRDGFGIVPYAALKAALSNPESSQPLFDIREVVVGPTKYPEAALASVRGLLASHGYDVDKIDIHRSKVPLRPL